MLYAELGRYPLLITIKTRIVGFWNRIVQGKQTKLFHLIYEHISSIDNFNCKWLNFVKRILDETGNSGKFIENSVVNVSCIKTYTYRSIVQEWDTKTEQSSTR